MAILIGMVFGFAAWFVVRIVIGGLYTVDQNERAVKPSFGRAERIEGKTTLDDPIAEFLLAGGTGALRLSAGPRHPARRPVFQDAVGDDPQNLHRHQHRQHGASTWKIPPPTMAAPCSKPSPKTSSTPASPARSAIASASAISTPTCSASRSPIVHVMAYFVSVLRQRIANFEAKRPPLARRCRRAQSTPWRRRRGDVIGISINDLRKNLRDLNEYMDSECRSSAARYGMILDASLITGIDPPPEVESALAAINTAHNQVSSDISLAQAAADQKIVQSRRAVEIETLKAQAEVEPLKSLAAELSSLKAAGRRCPPAYVRNVRLAFSAKRSRSTGRNAR